MKDSNPPRASGHPQHHDGALPGSPAAEARPGMARTAAGLALAARQRLPLLWWGGWAVLALSVPLLWLALTTEARFNGVSVWTKPWKFHVSVGLHLLTLAWFAAMLPATPSRERALSRMGLLAVACGVLELAYIGWRASRGEASHFNVGTPVAAVLYGLMGLGAVLLTACAGWLGWHIGRSADFAHGPVLKRGVAVGLVLGCVLGTLAGAYLSAQSGHWVGGNASDAQGLPVLGWARDGGDLRVAHFFGLHAMHGLPVLAWLAARQLPVAAARRAVDAAALAWVLLTGLVFAQAVRGQPFLG